MAGPRRKVDLEAENAELRAQNALLREQVATLRVEVEELKRRLGQNSSNSSKPPSSDPPMSRQERRALARKRAKESLRKQGGQPGHEGKHRQMAPPERVDEAFEHQPGECSGCGHAFRASLYRRRRTRSGGGQLALGRESSELRRTSSDAGAVLIALEIDVASLAHIVSMPCV